MSESEDSVRIADRERIASRLQPTVPPLPSYVHHSDTVTTWILTYSSDLSELRQATLNESRSWTQQSFESGEAARYRKAMEAERVC